MSAIIKLTLAALLPVGVSILLFILDRKTAVKNWRPMLKEVIAGIIFGGLAVIGTEFGVAMDGAQMNVRDASVITAGLFFGSWSGIIAGLIGGIERWVAVYWGVGDFTRVACTVSTILAGFFAAILRKYLFDKKRPGLLIAFAIGVIIEIFHMTMVFITHMDQPTLVLRIVKVCTIPMTTANGASLLLTSLCYSFFDKHENAVNREKGRQLSQMIQVRLLIAMLIALAMTSAFIIGFQNLVGYQSASRMLSLALDETTADISDASDTNLLEIAYDVKEQIGPDVTLQEIADKNGIAEISLVNKEGIIYSSTEPAFYGFNMATGEQSAAFLCLLDGETEEFVQNYGPIAYNPKISRKYAGVRTETGFIQIGYGAKQFQKDIDRQVVNLTANRHIGQTGYVMIIDMRSKIVSAPGDILPSMLKSCVRRIVKTEPDTVFLTEVAEIPCYCSYRDVEGYIVISVYPKEEALMQRDITIYLNTFMELMVFGVLFGLIYALINHVIVKQLKRVNQSLAKISSGDLDEVVDVCTNREFTNLSEDINSTVSVLKSYIAEAEARIDKELELAKNIQASALPNVFPAFPKRKDFDIFASMDPAKEVGGDFYDFYLNDADSLSFLVADVSGKGIPAAMFMMRAKTDLKQLTESGHPINEVFIKGNDDLCDGNDAGMFVTAWQGMLDLPSGHVRFVNAGHNPPLIMHDGKFEYLNSKAGFVLAGMEGVRYKMQELDLKPGDVIYLYTDGVTEATNAENELFGEERLLRAVNSKPFEDAKELCERVRTEVDKFVGEAPQFDDMTMVALEYKGIAEAPSIHFDEADLSDIPKVTEFVEGELEKIDCPMKTVIQFSVAIDEIFSNIVRYGYTKGKGPVTVQVAKQEEPRRVDIVFTDEGLPYNPLMKADPDTTLSAEERDIGGLGIYMVKNTMDDVLYRYENGQNILTIRKNL